jgi:putative membrane protein
VNWLQPPLYACVLSAALYVVGSRRRLRLIGRRPRYWSWRVAAFALSLVLAELVLSPPFDRIADQSLSGHMLQHVVLMSIVPPLVVLAAPWLTLWRGLPLELRRSLAGRVMAMPFGLRRAFRGLIALWPAWLLINVDLGVWHVPWLYDLTLRNAAIHDLEHVTFLAFGILFWIPVVDSPPLHARLDHLRRAVYLTAGATTGWLLAVVLALAPTPLYPAYAALPHRIGGLSAIADQQLAAGAMLGIGAIPFSIAVFVVLYRWLDEEKPARARPAAGAGRAQGVN